MNNKSSQKQSDSYSKHESVTKESLIRKFLKKRIKDQNIRLGEGYVDQMSIMALMDTPEATVVTIVEVYSILRQKGVNEKNSIKHIETMRSTAGQGDFNLDFSLFDFIEYRVQVEYPPEHLSKEHTYALMRESFPLYWNQKTEESWSENRIVALTFGLVVLAIGLGLGIYFGGWTWFLTGIATLFAWSAFKIGFNANEDELAMLTGDLPEMSDNELNEFHSKIHS